MTILKPRKALLVQVAACLLFPIVALAQGANPQSGMTLRLQGIDIDLNPDGSWKAIYATANQAVTMPDRRGVDNAYVIAEEKAKGAIARWFSQSVETGRVYTEAETTLESTLRSRGTGNDTFSTNASRNLTTSLRETFASSARAVLQGVTILEQSYNQKVEEVTVKVGISRGSIAAARSVQQGMQGTSGAGTSGGQGAASATGGREGVSRPPSEVRAGRTMPGEAPASAFRSFTAARGVVRGLHLRTKAEWDAYVKSGEKPADIPANPDEVYKGSWISWEDWLGV